MAELKTKPTAKSVTQFLNGIRDPGRRKDCRTVARIMRKATGAAPKMWGPSIVGFGNHHYRYASGREGDWFLMGFSPRVRDLTLYLMGGIAHSTALLRKLGRHTTGKGCLYLKTLDAADVGVLTELIEQSLAHLRRRDPSRSKRR